jgi:hypothetical protein
LEQRGIRGAERRGRIVGRRRLVRKRKWERYVDADLAVFDGDGGQRGGRNFQPGGDRIDDC